MCRFVNALVICLLVAYPAVAEPAEDPDNEEQYESDAKDGPNDVTVEQLADQVAGQISGPQLPTGVQSAQLLQAPVEKPSGIAAAAPASAPQATKASVKADAMNAKQAAEVAKQAAKVANRVAKHSLKVTGHAKKALTHALGALHDARVDSTGLGKHQKESLKKAEAHLREATKTAEYGKLKKVKEAQDLQKESMEKDLEKSKGGKTEKEQMRQEIQDLRKTLKEKNIDDKDIEKALDELEADLDKTNGPINDESKAELERLRQLVDSLEAQEPKEKEVKRKAGLKVKKQPLKSKVDLRPEEAEVAVPVQEKGFDIDTAMPYGDLEPFGREDTAQELTESSISESDEMVDQLERAEVAEEKRAVFRALTRLRGAAITSFDGVARSQTGNIDEYNKVQKWRSSHPLHHLADEESDVSKWAFPDNAD